LRQKNSENELSTIFKQTKNVDKTVRNISNSIVQLNMLATSGSIEAARAGEFGKGFAVVSSDIRNLAKDSKVNTDKIEDIVDSMNTELNVVNMDWNNLLSSQINEQELIDDLIENIELITDMLVDLLSRYTSLKDINDQNLQGLNQVMIGISEIQKAVELVARNANESRKASELILQAVSQIGDGVEELAVMADELQQG
jgi:methyl-accepting chemotaxis protein